MNSFIYCVYSQLLASNEDSRWLGESSAFAKYHTTENLHLQSSTLTHPRGVSKLETSNIWLFITFYANLRNTCSSLYLLEILLAKKYMHVSKSLTLLELVYMKYLFMQGNPSADSCGIQL